jgi:hypothetical protein
VLRDIGTSTSHRTTAIYTNECGRRASEKYLDTFISKLRRKNDDFRSGQNANNTTRHPEIGEIGRQTIMLLNTDHTP